MLCSFQLLSTKQGNKWRIEKIETALFYTNTEIDVIISETEVKSLKTFFFGKFKGGASELQTSGPRQLTNLLYMYSALFI